MTPYKGGCGIYDPQHKRTDPLVYGTQILLAVKTFQVYEMSGTINYFRYKCSGSDIGVSPTLATVLSGLTCTTVNDHAYTGGPAPTKIIKFQGSAKVKLCSGFSDPGDIFIWWESSSTDVTPTHDPQGNGAANHLTGITNPRGRLFLK